MAKGYILGPDALRQIRRLIREDRLEADRRTRSLPQSSAPGMAVYVGKTGSGGISALSGTTPGSGSVAIYRVTNAGALTPLLDQYNRAVTVTAYNIASSAVSGSTWVQLKQESVSGKLLVDVEDCG